MDKTEYRMRLDELTTLIEKQNYKGALEIVDSIDWRRVKSVKTLNMVADVYEVNKEYKRCKEMLLLAYDRAMIGKAILSRLVEISIKLGDLDDASEYYSEFVEAAPNDNSRFILKYKLYKARRAPVEEQIAILEDYKEREYTERWAYELARLYAQSGQQEKSVEVCDDLILWFSEGRYVAKAMELKMQYQPLSPSQKKSYDLYMNSLKKDSTAKKTVAGGKAVSEAAVKLPKIDIPKYPELKKKPKESTDELLQKMNSAGAAITQDASTKHEQMEDAEKEAALDHYSVTSPEFMGKTANLKEQLAKSIQEVFAGIKKPEEVKLEKRETATFGDTGEITIHDLEPEHVTSKVKIDTSAPKTVTARPEVKKKKQNSSEIDKTFEAMKVKSREELEKTQVSLKNFDLDALLKETASNLSEEIATGEFKKSPEAEKVQAVPAKPARTEQIIGADAAAAVAVGVAAAVAAVEARQQEAEQQKAEQTEKNQQTVPTSTEKVSLETVSEEIEAAKVSVTEEETRTFETFREEDTQATKTFSKEQMSEITRRVNASGNTVPMSIEEVLREETPEERRIRILNEGQPERFTDEQKKIFTYFAKIPGIDQQVLDAMSATYAHAGEKTSKRGNIAIMGAYGTGKSRLSDGIVRAICKDLGLTAVKYAKIDAADLNQKDPAAVIAKMSGGFLLIERAGLLYPEIIAKLTKAMEFRTDRMIVLIEDEKVSMRGLLRNNRDFAKKFDTVISIPVFTNDELVTFARTYARENGYKLDEMAVLALYTLIGHNQKESEPMTISKVKEVVDGAIKRAGRGTRRFGRRMSGKRTDEKNRIILYEKDFE
ncbi:MAG: hypothetical protein PHG16_06265 [Lachnospiraceae bacterium]|nr:hypothetical protein [Lachnospiraceae bacterium]